MGEPIDPYGGQPYDPYAAPAPYAYPPAYLPYQPPAPPFGPPFGPPPRPGTVVGAAVLNFVNAGLLLLASLVLFAAAQTRQEGSDDFVPISRALAPELAVDSVVDLVAAGLLIVAGVLLLGGRPMGQTITAVSAVIVVVATVYWIVRAEGTYGGVLVFGVMFAALAVVAVSLAFSTSARAWITQRVTEDASLRTAPRWGR